MKTEEDGSDVITCERVISLAAAFCTHGSFLMTFLGTLIYRKELQ